MCFAVRWNQWYSRVRMLFYVVSEIIFFKLSMYTFIKRNHSYSLFVFVPFAVQYSFSVCQPFYSYPNKTINSRNMYTHTNLTHLVGGTGTPALLKQNQFSFFRRHRFSILCAWVELECNKNSMLEFLIQSCINTFTLYMMRMYRIIFI